MMMRRRFVLGLAALAATTPTLVACTSAASREDAARQLRRADAANDPSVLHRLVRYATLAPSSHNSQCWTFHLEGSSIAIGADRSRRCPVVDPDDHHLFVSLGCATENLAHAALANGLQANASLDATDSVAVHLETTKARTSPLFQAITERQCTRGDYDGQALSTAELRLLEQAGSGRGVRIVLLTERTAIERVLDYVTAGNTAQLSDPAFVAELKSWIRFDHDEAVRSGDGLFAGASGNPALPRWLGSPLMDLAFTPKSENERYARQIRSSAGIAVFVSDGDDKAHWLEAGRCYERFALHATALGIRNAFVNQPVEVASLRPQFASALGLGTSRPDLVVRFGRGPTLPLSMRRPVAAVLV